MILKKKMKKLLTKVLAFTLVSTVLDCSAITVSASEKLIPVDGQVEKGNIVMQTRRSSQLQNSSDGISALDIVEGYVKMKDTEEVQWIDRIADLPEAISEFYDWMIESSDNDGYDDFLIEDEYFAKTDGVEVASVIIPTSSDWEEEFNSLYDEFDAYIAAAMCAFDCDHPEVFWLSGEWTTGANLYTHGDDYLMQMLFFPKDSENGTDVRAASYQKASAIKAAIEKRDNAVKSILDGVEGDDAYEQIKYFNETLTMINEYNTRTNLNAIDVDCMTCISGLTGSTGTKGPVCEGYARAFKVLCDQVGIPCVLVEGNATNSQNETGAHMWNYVELENAWYAVDVTWNDPVVSGYSGAVSSFESEEWLLVGADTKIGNRTFIKSHPVSNEPMDSLAFTNGPELSKNAYVPKLPTTLSDIQVENTEITYGENICVTVKASTEEAVATTQTMQLCIGNTVLDTSSQASKGVYTLEYSGRNVPAGNQILTINFAGGTGMAKATAEVKVTVLPKTIKIYAASASKYYGENDPAIGYSLDKATPLVGLDVLHGALSREAGEDIGEYDLTQGTLTSENNPNYELEFVTNTFTIYPAEYVVEVDTQQQIKVNDGNFGEPVFLGPNDLIVPGILTYTVGGEENLTYEQVVAITSALENETTCVVTYHFVTTSENYTGEKSGEITLTVDSCSKTHVGSFCPSTQYTDLNLPQWYHLNVDYVVSEGIMNGMGDTIFQPNVTTNRGMIVTILYRMSGEEVTEEAKEQCQFTDVEEGRYYTDAVAWAASKDIVKGVSETIFEPADPITREQMMVMLYRYAEYLETYDLSKKGDLSDFSDADTVSNYAKEALQWAYGTGMTTGNKDSNNNVILDPKGQTTRAQAAAFIHRFCEME